MAGKAISHVQGKGALAHNNREFNFKNVDPERTQNNIVYKSQSIDEAYRECFGEAQERFNEKQTRADRRIDTSYYEHMFGEAPESQRAKSVLIGSNKQKSFYEALVQVGDMTDSKVGTTDGELAAKCLDEYMKGFQDRNPNFHVFNAVLHLDEATPHLHIDYIPVGHYTRGMDTQNGLAKALEEMGHGKGKGAINEWRLSERKALEDICKAHGIEIKEPEKGRGYNLTPDEYKARIEAEKKQLEKEVEPIRELRRLKAKTEEIPIPKKTLLGKSDLSYEDAVKAIEGNNAYIANEAEIKNIRVNRGKVKKREDAVTERETAADGRERQLDSREKSLKDREYEVAIKERKADIQYLKNENATLHGKVAEMTGKWSEVSRENTRLQNKLNGIEGEHAKIVTSLQAQIDTLRNELAQVRENLNDKIKDAYLGFQTAVKGLNMLKYGWTDGAPQPYKANLTNKQGRLIDGITNKAAEWAREDGFPEIADTMKSEMGLSQSLEKAVKALEPKSRGHER